MKLQQATIENYRAIERLEMPLHPQLTVLHGDNGHGKTSVLSAIAVGLAVIPRIAMNMALGTAPRRSYPDFLDSDFRKAGEPKVSLKTTTGEQWHWRRTRSGQSTGDLQHKRSLEPAIKEIVQQDIARLWPVLDLPIVAFYDTDRAVGTIRKPDRPGRNDNRGGRYIRYPALDGALTPTDFQALFDWFYDRENEEIRQQRERRSFDYKDHCLDAVRQAIEAMLPGISRPRMAANPFRFVVSAVSISESGETETQTLELEQLSGGYRIVLALAADLARRMAQGNPHLDAPLQSEAIVLIDEVDLHLHPSWQQRALPDLMRTFPNAQFIVSTHSPQVLTTVKAEHIVELYRDGDNIVAGGASAPTYGAPAGDLLAAVMRVNERPPNNGFVTMLGDYMELVRSGKGESEPALKLRRKLDDLSPQDPGLDRADLEMRRQKVLKRIATNPMEET